uniref:Putative GIY YIG homing endonuclease n=1 Tax=Oogamochlamys gigantea TaxID=158507 RepID=A0A0S2LNC9_9CHLO|nr:putative GIY YIG homing endonuclease [Oogamochlamys gigantea]ALO62839.1 putative GIY YIG homing endonuclease [Oogamochlamys gigantea]
MPSSNNLKNKANLFDLTIKSGLYSITCIPLQKHYMGQSSYVTRRLNAHKSMLKRGCHENKALQDDYNKYGKNNFLFQKLLLGVGLPKNKLEKLEVRVLETLPPECRYNMYANWRKRESATNPFFCKKHTSEARRMQSDARKGLNSNFSGHTQSNEVKKIISQQNSGKKIE